MSFIIKFIQNYRKKHVQINSECNIFIEEIDAFLLKINSIFTNKDRYINFNEERKWINDNYNLLQNTCFKNITKYKRTSHYQELLKKQRDIQKAIYFLEEKTKNHNNTIISNKINDAYNLIGDIENKKLDYQQMSCIIKENHNQLVIAGAGTGKTTTIIGKVKFLIKSQQFSANDILVLSFTAAATEEIRKRIISEIGDDIEALTFHKLGLNIIKKAIGVSPKITKINLRDFIKEEIKQNIKDKYYIKLLNNYLLYNRTISKSEFDFKTETEYEEYLSINPPTTLNKELVKSYGEMDIANFLMKNGIKYIYEQPYCIDTRTNEYGQYVPDFYLPEFDIYIEYFGINKAGDVPSYFKSKHGITPTQAYHDAITWKRDIHKKNNTKMIECYAYEKFDNLLLDNLQQKLIDNSVILTELSDEELWKNILNDDINVFDEISELFETIINLMKSNRYTPDILKQMIKANDNTINNKIVLELLKPIYISYQDYLEKSKEIDFNDMINMAADCIDHNKYNNPYKYIIIDEYQDMSISRFKLLNSMRKSRDYSLFCVGDDWQSIYRFAGSDVGLILNFENYWGKTEINKIETTYRFNQKLIEISSNFIMKNNNQLIKNIRGVTEEVGFPLEEICGYTDELSINFMLEKLNDLPRNSSVFFIGRYLLDINLLKNNQAFKCQYNNHNKGLIDVKYYKRSDLSISFLTAHKAKGLQADYVFIINNKNGKMGFPSQIQDIPILNILLDNSDNYPFAEERRLFYVALTRAKKKVFLLTINNHKSSFATELISCYAQELKDEQYRCPLCGGKLLKKEGSYGYFFGCSNYRNNGCTYKRNCKN